ncbi:hypothetical protein RHSIM_Rhsim13G0209900 [Rhododendron simsii]|uniref:Uncharacterized protein n=1 Tax=Rhododendron simsii TaxID=118357 RepID=A0A834G6C6_RHOSS|nr:hypothetical protein RHSIM_Rhsim13G0209900 [Rhododendron simsii]
MSKSPSLLAYAPAGPLLYSINFSENSTTDCPKSSLWRHKKGNFCRRCRVDLFGDQDNDELAWPAGTHCVQDKVAMDSELYHLRCSRLSCLHAWRASLRST